MATKAVTKTEQAKNGLLPTPPMPAGLPKANLTDNARQVLMKRYVRRGDDGKPAENVEEMFWRVAYHVAKVEAMWGGDIHQRAVEYYHLLSSKKFFPNSPTFTGAGTPLGQLAACFTSGMRVTTDLGVKQISELQIGDRVLTHEGRYRPVTELFQRAYDGELLNIKVRLIGTTMEVTPEHPILTEKGWVKAGDLRVGDKVAIGTAKGKWSPPVFDLAVSQYEDELELQVNEESIRARRPSTYQNSGRQAEWVNRFIECTPDLARLCGYYVSEGTIDPSERYVRFTFAKDETEYQNDVVNLVEGIFGARVNSSASSFGNWMNINVYSRPVAAWFRESFGRGSTKKRLPVWLQHAEREIQESFLVGVMRGDGLYFERTYVVPSRPSPKLFRSLRLTLSNPGLIQQIWQMCLRLGYDAAIRPVDTTYVTPNASDASQISMPPLQSRELVKKAFGVELPEPDARYVRNKVTRDGEGRVYFDIESITAQSYSGIVYNCEVDEDHTYVTEGVVVHNCFVLPITDDMGRDRAGIFQTLRDAALIQQTGGGNGFSFSRLRPHGAMVQTSAGQATGPVGFLRVYDHAFGEIAQGGTRRGANMAVLRVDHPDVEDFIACKINENQITNFNISVGITDAFMRAVKNDEEWELCFPDMKEMKQKGFSGTLEQAEAAGITIHTYKKVKARELFDKIVKQAHHNGEPGVLFLDAANRSNPVPHLYPLEATNPCGEQWLGPYENCCLGSVNLNEHCGPDGTVDWELLRQSVVLATRFLDDVVESNAYVPAVPQLTDAAHKARRIGLGIMGLADLMYHAGVRYGSQEGQEFGAQVMEFVRYHAMMTSIELAKERGAFPAIEGSIYDKTNMKWAPPKTPIHYQNNWGRPNVEWDAVVDGIRKHGIRNAAQTTVAPTGTIATVAGCEGYGCEPVFALAYIRHVNDNGKDLKLAYASPRFDEALKKLGLGEEKRQEIVEQVMREGTCQHIKEIPQSARDTFVVSADITAEEHVRTQGALQAFVDNSLSKTVNFPEGATEADVATAYMLAWDLGCKGITVYVTGSRDKVVLETNATADKKAPLQSSITTDSALNASSTGQETAVPPLSARPEIAPTFSADPKKPRPRALTGKTYNVETPVGKAFITINENGDEQPFEAFINTAKAGSETAAVSEAIGRLVSYILRMTSTVKPTDRMREIVRQLIGIGGGRSLGFGPNRVRSLPDGIGQVLDTYLREKDGLKTDMDEKKSNGNGGHTIEEEIAMKKMKIGDLCPECGEAAVVNEEGCRKCYACGFSEC
ncbi:MAG: adenosylcobalamin-dependent ribonucleoside-diphosphate reductase [Anaerolineales bacterium]|nr:adenosylcobalamin-dependent ribonucleoside-diphosphate reductase [Anaerolineales bacterium]